MIASTYTKIKSVIADSPLALQLPTTPSHLEPSHLRCQVLFWCSHPTVATFPDRLCHACSGAIRSPQPVTVKHKNIYSYIFVADFTNVWMSLVSDRYLYISPRIWFNVMSLTIYRCYMTNLIPSYRRRKLFSVSFWFVMICMSTTWPLDENTCFSRTPASHTVTLLLKILSFM